MGGLGTDMGVVWGLIWWRCAGETDVVVRRATSIPPASLMAPRLAGTWVAGGYVITVSVAGGYTITATMAGGYKSQLQWQEGTQSQLQWQEGTQSQLQWQEGTQSQLQWQEDSYNDRSHSYSQKGLCL